LAVPRLSVGRGVCVFINRRHRARISVQTSSAVRVSTGGSSQEGGGLEVRIAVTETGRRGRCSSGYRLLFDLLPVGSRRRALPGSSRPRTKNWAAGDLGRSLRLSQSKTTPRL
jgi:hypothetical protein